MIKTVLQNYKDLFVHLMMGFLLVMATIFNLIMFFYSEFSHATVSVITFIDILFVIFFCIRRIENKLNQITNEQFLNFLNFSKGKIFFTDISSFLGEQAFVSFFGTFTIITSKHLILKNSFLGGIYLTLLFVFTVSFTVISASRLLLIISSIDISRMLKVIFLVLMAMMMHIFYIIGLRIGAITEISWL